MVKEIKVKRPEPYNSFFSDRWTRINNGWLATPRRIPPPTGGSPVFNYIDGNRIWGHKEECSIIAGRVDCGSNPNPIGALTLPRFDIIEDKCNYGIMMTFPWLAGTKWSFFTYFRRDECDDTPEEFLDYNYQFELPDPCDEAEKVLYIWWKVDSIAYEDFATVRATNDSAGYFYGTSETSIEYVVFPENEYEIVDYGYYQDKKKIYAKIGVIRKYYSKANKVYQERYFPGSVTEALENGDEEIEFDELLFYEKDHYQNLGAGTAYKRYSDFIKYSKETFQEVRELYRYKYGYDTAISVSFEAEPTEGCTSTPYREICRTFQEEGVDFLGFRYFIYRYNITHSMSIEAETWFPLKFCEESNAPQEKPKKRKRSSPPPPPPPMRCCPDNSDLLKRILRKVTKLSDAVGVDEYPASLPSSFIKEGLFDSGTVKKENLTTMLGWYFERFDEVLGQFEIELNIQDTDASQAGDQSAIIKLPNVAESLAEIMMLLINNSYNSDLTLNLVTKNLIEAGQTKQSSYINNQAIESIIDFLGYKTKTINEKIPLSFTPGSETFEELIKENEINVPIVEIDDNRTLPTILQELLHASAIIRALYWKKLDPNKDFKEQIKQDIVETNKFINNISQQEDAT